MPGKTKKEDEDEDDRKTKKSFATYKMHFGFILIFFAM